MKSVETFETLRASASESPADPLPARSIRRWSRTAGFLFFVWVLLLTSVATVVDATISFLVMFGPGGRERLWWITRAWSRHLLAIAGVKVETTYEHALPDGPVIFVANHQGNYDICAMFLGLDRRFVFAAKKSVFRYPFLGWSIRAAGYIEVDRGNRGAAIRSLEAAGEKVRAGTSVAFYAEGTRSSDGSILPFKKGPFMYALKAGVPIIPVALEGSLQVNPKRTWYVCPNTIRILVGPPIPTAGLSEAERDTLIARVRGHVIRQHRRLGGLGGDEHHHIAAAGLEGIGRPAGGEPD